MEFPGIAALWVCLCPEHDPCMWGTALVGESIRSSPVPSALLAQRLGGTLAKVQYSSQQGNLLGVHGVETPPENQHLLHGPL